jgi:hypothetical protein
LRIVKNLFSDVCVSRANTSCGNVNGASMERL